MPRPSLSAIIAFCAVASHRSFRRAADELGVMPSTLSHTINGLERDIGLRLLHRTTRSVATTEAGEHLRRRMEPLLQEFDTVLDEAQGFREHPSGRVRISAAAPAIRPLMDVVLPTLQARYPDIHVEFVADGRMVDIVEQGFDAGIRFGDAVPKDMIGVPFGPTSRFVAVASAGYIARYGSPQHLDDLAAHRCIRMRLTTGRILRWSFSQNGRERTIEPEGTLTFDDVPLQLDAAVSGLGIAYVWEDAARPLLASGAIRIVLSDWTAPKSRLFLYYPGHRQVPPALRAFIDVLRMTPNGDV